MNSEPREWVVNFHWKRFTTTFSGVLCFYSISWIKCELQDILQLEMVLGTICYLITPKFPSYPDFDKHGVKSVRKVAFESVRK